MTLRGRAGRACVHVALAAAGAAQCYAALRLARHAVPLRRELGEVVWLVGACLGVGIVSLALAWSRVWRGQDPRPGMRAVRGLAYAALATTVVCLTLLQPFARLPVELALGCGAGLWAIAVASWDRITARVPHGLVRIGDLVLFNLCLLGVTAELGLRTLAHLRPSPLLVRGDTRAVERIEAHRMRPRQLNWGVRCNSAGFYDQEFLPRAERQRPMVAMIGDSFQVGIVPLPFHFTSVAEREMAGVADIYSVGVSATGFPEYQHLLEGVALPLEPQVVVVSTFVGNDFNPGLLSREDSPFLRELFDRERLLLSLLPRRLGAIARAGEATLDAAAAAREDVGDLDEAGCLRQWPWLDDYRKERPGRPAAAYLELETRIAQTIGVPGRAGFDAALAILRAMHERVREVPFAVMIIPDELQVEDALWQEITAQPGQPDMERFQPQRILAEFCRAQGIPCLDLLPVLRAVPLEADGRRHCYHVGDTHLNVRGNLHAGRALASFLEPLLARAPR